MIEKALRYLVGLGERQVVEAKGKTYLVGGGESKLIEKPLQNGVVTATLQSIVDYLHKDPDHVLKSGTKVIIHIQSPTEVKVFTEVNEDKRRHILLIVMPDLLDRFTFDFFYELEEFNIALQSRFCDSADRARILALVGNVTDGTAKTFGDNGVSQSATVKTGAASVADVEVPNPVILAPYRTFPEVEQPQSPFILRMRSGEGEPRAALFEADGGAWKLAAIAAVKAWLEEALRAKLGNLVSNITILS